MGVVKFRFLVETRNPGKSPPDELHGGRAVGEGGGVTKGSLHPTPIKGGRERRRERSGADQIILRNGG